MSTKSSCFVSLAETIGMTQTLSDEKDLHDGSQGLGDWTTDGHAGYVRPRCSKFNLIQSPSSGDFVGEVMLSQTSTLHGTTTEMSIKSMVSVTKEFAVYLLTLLKCSFLSNIHHIP